MADQWFIARNNKKHGPFTAAKLKELATQGRLLPSDMLLKDGMAKWVAASSVKGLFPEQSSMQPISSPGGHTTPGKIQSPAANPFDWVQKQYRENPQRVLLAGGGAAFGLVFVICLGCIGLFTIGGNGGGGLFTANDALTEDFLPRTTGSDQESYKELIVGKWFLDEANESVEFTKNGNTIMTSEGKRVEGAYKFISKDKVQFLSKDKSRVAFTVTVSIEEDELTQTTEDGHILKFKRVGGTAKKTRTKSVATTSFITKAKYDQIKIGMPREKVWRIIGGKWTKISSKEFRKDVDNFRNVPFSRVTERYEGQGGSYALFTFEGFINVSTGQITLVDKHESGLK